MGALRKMREGKLFIISGASGVGKSTVIRRLMAARQDLKFAVSATTRAPRPGEKHGVQYYFVTPDQFKEMIAAGDFVEYDAHMGNLYGTPKFEVSQKRREGHLVLDIEPRGALNVRKIWPEANLIFIAPPSVEELEHRLRGRGDTSEEQVQMRLKRALWEMSQKDQYDIIVINDTPEGCADRILKFIDERIND